MVGRLLRAWRQRRHLTQLDLALEAAISTRHLSFIETGRAQPSRDMLLHLAELLRVPLGERNALLLAGGFAPRFHQRPLDAPELAAARFAVERLLAAHEPYPALAVDARWNLVTANRATLRLAAGAAPELLAPPANVLRLSLHPDGLGRCIVNYEEWQAHVLLRLRRHLDLTGDPEIRALGDELAGYGVPPGAVPTAGRDDHIAEQVGIAIPLRLRHEWSELALLSTTTVFGTAVDVTLSGITLESFFPLDAATAAKLHAMAADAGDARGAPGGVRTIDA